MATIKVSGLAAKNTLGGSEEILINDGGVSKKSTVAGITLAGEVTGAVTGVVIAANVVDEANLKVSNTPTNGYVLTAQSGNTGGLTWAQDSATDNTKLPLAGGTMTGTITSTHATALQLTNNTTSKIHFGDSGNASIGKIEYVHSSNHLAFKVNDAERLRIDSSGRVGIGVAAPDTEFHVVGLGTVAKFEATDGPAYINLKDDDGTQGFMGLDAGSFVFQTSGSSYSNKLVITSAGNVGIGVAAPAEMLEIYNATSPAIQLNDGGDYKSIFRMAGNDLEIRGSSGSLEFYNGSADGDSSAQRMTIDASGNLGIGVASPAYTLDVYKSAIGDVARFNSSSGNRSLNFISSTVGSYVGAVWTRDINSAGGQHVWSNNGSERMRINSSGNVGIGVVPQTTATAFDALELGGNAMWTSYGTQGAGGEMDFGHNFYHNPDGNSKYLSTDEASMYRQGGGKHIWHTLASASAGTNINWTTAAKMTLDASGNLGIGVVPSAMSSTYDSLQIGSVGSIFSHASATGDGSTFFGSNIYNNSGWKYITTNEASFIQQKNGEFYFARAVSGSAGASASFTYPMVITSAGNVGIGVEAPSFENGTGLEIRYAGGNGAHLKLTDNASGAGGTNGFDLYTFNTNAYIENYEAGSLVFRNNGGERMRIDASGNVGIGNSIASTFSANADNLVIGSGSGHNGMTIYSGNTSAGNIFFADSADNNEETRGGISYQHNGNQMQFRVNDANRMEITSAGNVGIGTTSPQELLEISGNSSPAIEIDNTSQRWRIGAGWAGGTSSELFIHDKTDNRLDVLLDGTGNVKVVSGNLVIGTSGKGIDFSATSDGSGTDTSELLDDYEEGTWTPTWSGANPSNATYTKIGRVVYASGQFAATGSGTTGDCGGLPYASAIDGSDGGGSGYHGQDAVTWSVLKINSTGFRFYTGSSQKQLADSNPTRFFLTYHV